MALDMDTIKNRIKDNYFFTARRDVIEYLIEENLDPLEEYALLISLDKPFLFTPHTIRNNDVTPILYEGYSNHVYQNKMANIIEKLDEFTDLKQVQVISNLEHYFYIKAFTEKNIIINDASTWFKELLSTKTVKQVRNLEKCADLNMKAFQGIAKNFKLGMNELDAFKLIKESYYQSSQENIPFIADIVSGKRTIDISGPPTDYQPKLGDTMILDLLPRYKGVYCDHTRTFFMGEAREKQRYIYQLLVNALDKAEKILKPDTKSNEIYKVVYETFKKEGLEYNFPHHGGHGFGLTIYEPPYFIRDDEEVLKAGMVVAIEPGLYLQDEFGIRIENNYLITETGYQVIGNIPLNIENYIIS